MTVAALQRALGDHYLRREKEPESRRWRFYARGTAGDEVLAASVHGGPTRTLEDLRAPLRIDLYAQALFDLERLHALLGTEFGR